MSISRVVGRSMSVGSSRTNTSDKGTLGDGKTHGWRLLQGKTAAVHPSTTNAALVCAVRAFVKRGGAFGTDSWVRLPQTEAASATDGLFFTTSSKVNL